MTRPHVHGSTVDEQTRCVHYATELDVIAIRFACCDRYFPCHLCHEEVADHEGRAWPAGSGAELAVLCGVCSSELSIDAYRGAPRCPECAARFNPRCAAHYPLYFD
ncbi:MAG: hypothetical protein LBE25_07925 [Arthrobacter sp.]|jgi:uncharacterized CHY-type Zn-finger protein|nr:hypothetical protein [Arthrobacter sp.]